MVLELGWVVVLEWTAGFFGSRQQAGQQPDMSPRASLTQLSTHSHLVLCVSVVRVCLCVSLCVLCPLLSLPG